LLITPKSKGKHEERADLHQNFSAARNHQRQERALSSFMNMNRPQRIWEIVLTGGPSSGKTSSLARLSETLENEGLRVLVVPELATTLVTGGLSDLAVIPRTHPQRFHAVEEQMILLHQDLRTRYRALAKALEEDTVILYDRGEMDGCAYLGRKGFERILEDNGLGYAEVRDNYDHVIHLVSTAVDAAAHYSTENNIARTETVAEAVIADRLCLDAWTGAHLTIIDNSTDFEGKLKRVEDVLLQIVGAPAALEIERKFLLARAPDLTTEPLSSSQMFEITQTYLRSDGETERRLRLRAHAGQETCIYTEKRPTTADPLIREEVEARISRSEYRRLMAEADGERQPIIKTRRVFVYANHVFELDSYGERDLHILEVELHSLNESVQLPPTLEISREVTADPAYRNHALAARA
jgi:CYTH domain-containing protein/predicted ATPase